MSYKLWVFRPSFSIDIHRPTYESGANASCPGPRPPFVPEVELGLPGLNLMALFQINTKLK